MNWQKLLTIGNFLNRKKYNGYNLPKRLESVIVKTVVDSFTLVQVLRKVFDEKKLLDKKSHKRYKSHMAVAETTCD